MKVDRCLYHKEYHRGILEKFIKMTVYQKDKVRNVLELVKPQPGDEILEVGCSGGAMVFLCAQHGAASTGVDFDEKAIELALEHQKSAPDLYSKCRFLVARAEDVIEEVRPNKVNLIDFTEHVPDDVLLKIYEELRRNPHPAWTLHIYTPNREHWVEHLKKRNIILKEEPTHTDLRNMEENIALLEKAGYTITRNYYRPFHLPFFRLFEYPLSALPLAGRLFRRRVCITAVVSGDDGRQA